MLANHKMIESQYWKEDLVNYQKKFQPKKKPPRWSEKLQVNFEKDVTIAFFMIRKLIESKKLSSRTANYTACIYRSLCVKSVNNMNFWDIDKLYDLEREEQVSKKVVFLCNQLIHGGAIYAYRGTDRNWGGIYTCSDFERQKYVYKIPLNEILQILKITGHDYPQILSWKYSEAKGDYVVITD